VRFFFMIFQLHFFFFFFYLFFVVLDDLGKSTGKHDVQMYNDQIQPKFDAPNSDLLYAVETSVQRLKTRLINERAIAHTRTAKSEGGKAEACCCFFCCANVLQMILNE
jgi:hypothetical protein